MCLLSRSFADSLKPALPCLVPLLAETDAQGPAPLPDVKGYYERLERASAVGLKAWAILLSHLLMQGHRWLGDTPAALRISGCNFVASDGKLGFESEVGAGRNARYCAKACVPMARAGRTLVNSCRGSPLKDRNPIIGSASVITRSHPHQRV